MNSSEYLLKITEKSIVFGWNPHFKAKKPNKNAKFLIINTIDVNFYKRVAVKYGKHPELKL